MFPFTPQVYAVGTEGGVCLQAQTGEGYLNSPLPPSSTLLLFHFALQLSSYWCVALQFTGGRRDTVFQLCKAGGMARLFGVLLRTLCSLSWRQG